MEITYEEFIQNILNTRGRFACGDEYHERHHIVPRCMDGDDEKENLVDLYAREHFIAHKLLMQENPDNISLARAYTCMAFVKDNNQDRYELTPEEYEDARIVFSHIQSERMRGENNHFFGKTHTDETKQILSMLGKERYKDSKNIYHPIISEDRKIEIGKEHSKIIIQYDMNMNLIAIHDSLLSLEKKGYRRASIRAVCLGKKESYKGYIWRYNKESDAWVDGYIVGTCSDNIYCLDINMNVIGVYKSYLEASRYTGVNRRIISRACKSDTHYYFGCYWLYKHDYENLKNKSA